MELKVYSQKGEETGKVKLNDKIFSLPWNNDLVHQVIVSMQANLRTPIAHAKGRGEVRGGGKKPWKQKGTGRARHGSTRSPIWIGGGVTHGPVKEKDYSKKINKKMMKKALWVILSQKARDGEILMLNDLKIEEAKTKKAAEIISALGKIEGFEKMKTKRKNRAEILMEGKNENISRAFRNLPGVSVDKASNLNPLNAMTYKYLIFSEASIRDLK